MEGSRQKDEKKVMGASYIYDFYTIVSLLNDSHANYGNIIMEIVHKYSEEYLTKINDAEKQFYLTATQNLRYYIIRSYIMFKSILKALKDSTSYNEIEEAIDKDYKKIKDNFGIERETVEDYVINLNSFITQDLIKKLLEDNADLINELYSKNVSEQQSP